MPEEIEAKIPFDDLAALVQRLTQAQAQPIARLAEVNIFLDRPGLSLRRTGQGLRVRVEHDRDTGLQRSIIVTHKGPRRPGPIKSRMETEMHVQSLSEALALLGALGYRETLRFEKHRDRWRLDGCLVELDTLPVIGRFVEIEGPGVAIIEQVRAKLGLSAIALEPDGYAALLHRELVRRGIHDRDIRFYARGVAPQGRGRHERAASDQDGDQQDKESVPHA